MSFQGGCVFRCRRNASVIVEYSSSGGDRVTHAADGDLATVWEADGNSNEWITLDLRDSREVAAVRIQVLPHK